MMRQCSDNEDGRGAPFSVPLFAVNEGPPLLRGHSSCGTLPRTEICLCSLEWAWFPFLIHFLFCAKKTCLTKDWYYFTSKDGVNNTDVWVWLRHKNTPVVIGNEIDCHTQVSKSAWSSNSVEIGLSMFGEVKIDDNIYCLDINSSGKQICGEYKESAVKYTQMARLQDIPFTIGSKYRIFKKHTTQRHSQLKDIFISLCT